MRAVGFVGDFREPTKFLVNKKKMRRCEDDYIVLIKPALPLSIPAKNRLAARWKNVRESPNKSIARHKPVKPNLVAQPYLR